MTTAVMEATKERPLIFAGDMVRAALDGRKTKTRRVMVPQPSPCNHESFDDNPPTEWKAFEDDGTWYCTTCGNGIHPVRKDCTGIRCPYGVPGDRLWVRENFQPLHGPDIYRDWKTGRGYDVSYPATEGRREFQDVNTDELSDRVMPSIHMPRWASRLTLEITEIQIQRLQEISGHDVLAEGVDNGSSNPTMGARWENMQRMAFEKLWDSINAKRGYPWASNPWVWALTFRVVQR